MKDDTEKRLEEFKMLVPDDDGSASDWFEQVLSKTIREAVAEERARIRGVMQEELKLLSGAYAGLETLTEKSANIAIRDSFIRILASLDEPVTEN